MRVSKYLVSRVPGGLEFYLGSSLGSYLGCRKGHSQPGWALGAPACPRACLGLGLYSPCTLPLPISQQIKILCICTGHNPQTGTAGGLKIQSSTSNPSSPTRRKALRPHRPPPWPQTKGHGSRGQGVVGGSAGRPRRAAGAAFRAQAGGEGSSQHGTVAPERNARKRGVQTTGVAETRGREKERMACEGV